MLAVTPQDVSDTKITVTGTATALYDLINTASSKNTAQRYYDGKFMDTVMIQPESGDLRMLYSANPTATQGELLKSGVKYYLCGGASFAMRLISVSGLNVAVTCTFYRTAKGESPTAVYGPGALDAMSVKFGDSPSNDAFGRLRTSAPFVLFDTKLTHTAESEFWDDQEVSGSGTSSTFNANRASSVLAVSATTAGKRVRQTYARPNYQPGKSQLILMTGIIGSGESGITAEIGQHDDENGLFFRNEDGTMYVVVKTYATGSAVDTAVAQSSWNLDKMDGTGASGITIDWDKTQIFVIDYEWLGVGRVRFGLNIDGITYYVHEVLNANSLDVVYMSNPNNPLRYSIENDGTGGAASLEHICTSVISEGGQDGTGVDYYYSTNGTHVDANAADTIYAVVGIRLRTGHPGEPVKFRTVSMISETNDDFEWILYRNPTVAGTFTYANEGDGPFQTAKGATANTVTNGTAIAGGYAQSNATITSEIFYEGGFGMAIDGTRDEFVLCVRPLSANADIQGSITVNVNH
jgi:hypothetical protein